MPPRKADTSRIDPNGASLESHNVFGLDFTEDESSVVLLPIPWEVTTSYGGGTAAGPATIRAASAQVDLFDAELANHGLGQPWAYGIHLADADPRIVDLAGRGRELARPIIDLGGRIDDRPDLLAARVEVNAFGDEVDARLYERVRRLLDGGRLVGVVGGDHSVPLGAIRAHAERYPGLGILHVDAHADLRLAYEGFEHSHASIMSQVLAHAAGVAVLCQVGIRDLCDDEMDVIRDDARVVCHFDHQLRDRQFSGETWQRICDSIVEPLPERVYVSFDIDGLDPTLCPNTGTPVPGGLSYAQAIHLLLALHRHGKRLVGFDLTEVAPAPGGDDEWDGNVGARLLYKLCGLALLTNGARDDAAATPTL